MEKAIMTIVNIFLKSAKGKEDLDSEDFQEIASNHLGGISEVKNCIIVTALQHSLIYTKTNQHVVYDINTKYVLFASFFSRI